MESIVLLAGMALLVLVAVVAVVVVVVVASSGRKNQSPPASGLRPARPRAGPRRPWPARALRGRVIGRTIGAPAANRLMAP